MEHPTARTYYTVFATLLALLAVTVIAGALDLGPVSLFVAATVATIKAILILLFFMHVLYSPKLIWAVAAAAFFWLAILFGLTFSDYATRTDVIGPPGLEPGTKGL
jgi:cytochrome c oxidase subunit IV